MTTNRAVAETKRGSDGEVMPVTEADDVLPVRYQLFVDAYLASNFNATEAATAAGYSPKSARQQGVRLLKNASIMRAIQRATDKALEPFQVKKEEVLGLLVSHMRGTFADFLNTYDGSINFEKAERAEKLHLIRKVRSRATTIIRGDESETHIVESEIEMYDAQSAADKLARHLGLYNDKLHLSADDMSKMSDDELLKLAEGKKP